MEDASKATIKQPKSPIPPGHRLALPMALAYGRIQADLAHAKATNDTEEVSRLTSLVGSVKRRTTAHHLSNLADTLLLSSGISTFQPAYLVEDITKIAKYLVEYKIRLYSRRAGGRYYAIDFEYNQNATKIISISYVDGMFNYFLPNASTIGQYVCKLCSKYYLRIDRHNCAYICQRCRSVDCYPILDTPIHCTDCNNYFFSEKCYRTHRSAKDKRCIPICKRFKRCPLCDVHYKPENLKGPHVCGKAHYCTTCKQHVSKSGHECCWSPPTARDYAKKISDQAHFKILVYDFETVVLENSLDVEDYAVQWANYVSYSLMCENCYLKSSSSSCDDCGELVRGSFRHNAGDPRNTVVKQFTSFLLNDRRLDGAIVIAHNASRFDIHFMIYPLLESGIKPDVLRSGMKILCMTVSPSQTQSCNRLSFKDSCLFLPMKLSSLPKAFGIPDTVKGTFPFLFNHPDNYGKILPTLPPKEYYQPQHMDTGALNIFETYYLENYNTTFDMDSELARYCDTDVDILRQSLGQYMYNSIQATELNPIVHATTYSSFAFMLIKYKHMKKYQVAIVPEDGFSEDNDNQSVIAVKMIAYIEHSEGIELQSILKGGEYSFNNAGRTVKADAYHATTNTIIEIDGCFFHGCAKHTNQDAEHPFKKVQFREVLADTMRRHQLIRDSGYNLRIYWEHDIQEALRTTPEMKRFFDTFTRRPRLAIRDGLFGGRCQSFKLRYTPGEGETIEHWDANSLYPSCLFHNDLPHGAPTVIRKDFKPLVLPLPYHGVFYIDILPPTNLLYPIVPMRSNGRLVFTLCRTCGENMENEPCDHITDEERMINVVITQPELEHALAHGYRVIKVYEVWHWNRWNKTLFHDYLKQFLALKWYSSGFPANTSEEDKVRMMKEFEESQGFSLDPSMMCANAPMRVLSKAMLNAVWGRFCMRNDRITTKFVAEDSDALVAIFEDPAIEDLVSETFGSTIMMSYRLKEECRQPMPFTNCVIAAFTTAYGRVTLHKAMHRLGDRLLYVDTDSVIMVSRKGEDNLENLRGLYPLYWSDENPDRKIIDFCSTGSKVYAYKLLNESSGEVETVLKARGMSLDSSTTDSVNFDQMARMAEDHTLSVSTKRPQIVKKFGRVLTREMVKVLRPVLNKLRVFDDYSTLPYGWRYELQEQ